MTGQPAIIDAGPLVALLHRRDEHHQWARHQMNQLPPPLLTCDAVITEACFLLKGVFGGQAAVFNLLQRGIIEAPFRLQGEVKSIAKLLERYANVPMSFADACLVRMSELKPHHSILTIDSDFNIYRRNGKEIIPIIMP